MMRWLGAALLLAPVWVDVIQGPDGGLRIERPERLEPVKIELRWDAAQAGTPEVAAYEVYRAVEVARTTGTTCVVDRVLSARPYWYAVRAVGRDGTRSAWSTWIEMAVPP